MNKNKLLFDACIFDLDGVIVDTAHFHYIAWKELANKLGFDFLEKDNEKLKGVSRMTSLDILLDIGNIELETSEKQKLAEQKNNRYREFIAQMTPKDVLAGILDFIKILKENKIKIAIASASKNAPEILQKTNILHLFDAVIDGNQIEKAKPNPQVFLKAANAINSKPEKCIVFEDAQKGIEAALKANMLAIGIGQENNLENAHKVFNSFEEFDLNILNEIFLKEK